jgi:hypothetical protein
MHNPASLAENITKAFLTMTEHVRVIYCLWICLTHVCTRVAIAPRPALASKKPNCAGKSTALENRKAQGLFQGLQAERGGDRDRRGD